MITRVHDPRAAHAARRSSSSQRSKSVRLALVVALLVSAPGCTGLSRWMHQGFKVGPDYCRPPAPVADEWIDFENPDVDTSTATPADWWSVFNDPVLNELIETASQQNLTLRAAGMRILEARARLNIARGSLLPQAQQAFGDYARVNLSNSLANPFPVPDFDVWSTGFNAAWELDFWGRFRRNIESKDALLNAEIENYDSVLVILQGDVASAYIQYRTLQSELQLAEKNVALQQRTLEIADVQFRNGKVTELDVAQAKENLAATKSLIPRFESGLRETGNALCVLLGVPPRDLTAELGDGPIPTVPKEIIAGIPAELLRRRPDVRRAERLAAAQSAAIGVAESDLYPRIAITGMIGYSAENLSNLFDSQSVIGTIGPGFQWNVLNYGRIRNNVRANEAAFYKLVYDYQNTVLAAAREVEDGIVKFLKERERVATLNESAAQAARAVEISTTQYRRGKTNFQPVVYMQQILADRQDQLAQSRGAVATNVVLIYKALGGGWQVRINGATGVTAMEPSTQPAAAQPPTPNDLAPTPAKAPAS